MERQGNSSDKSPGRSLFSRFAGQFGYFIGRILQYYSRLISNPFQSGLVYFAAGLIAALFVGWILFPVALYSEQEQPVNFSHAIHTDPDIIEVIEGDTDLERCSLCHFIRYDGTFSGIPKLETCMECHDDPDLPLGESAEEKFFLTEFVANDKEIPWLSYSKQPDCVYFSHVTHAKMGNLECKICHGPYADKKELPVYQENRLTGYSRDIYGRNIMGYKSHPWDSMKMDDCAECHTAKGLEQNNACFVCHK